MKKIFISGSFASRNRLSVYRQRLRDVGYTVCSEWLDEIKETWPNEQESRKSVQRDFSEIQDSDLFVLDTLEPSTMGNSYVELGIALASVLCTVYLIGPMVNHYSLLCAQQFKTWEEFLEFLGSY